MRRTGHAGPVGRERAPSSGKQVGGDVVFVKPAGDANRNVLGVLYTSEAKTAIMARDGKKPFGENVSEKKRRKK
jgi:hypothetical protein